MIFLASRAPDRARHVAACARVAVSRGDGRGGLRASGGRYVRPRGHRGAVARRGVAFAVLLLVMLVPTVARAEIVYDPLPNTIDGLVAPYEFSLDGRLCAAGEVLGRGYSSLSSEQQQYIRDYAEGNNYFVKFANEYMANCGYQSSPNTNALVAMFPFWTSTFGVNEIWYFQADEEAVSNAQADYDLAWNAYLKEFGYGGDGGTSVGGSVIDGDSYVFTMPTYYATSIDPTLANIGNKDIAVGGVRYVAFDGASISSYNSRTEGVDYEQYPALTTLRVPVSAFGNLGTDYDKFAVFQLQGSGNLYVNVYCLKSGTYTFNVSSVTRGNSIIPTITFESSEAFYNQQVICTSANLGEFTYVQKSSRYSYSAGSTLTYPVNTLATTGSAISYSENGGGSNEPTYPDPPQPPEIPEPDPPENDPIDDPGITLPPIDFPDLVLPDIDYTVQTPSGTDVVPYLKKIIANQEDIAAFLSGAIGVLDEDLDNIGEALGEHCNHIQQQMQKQVYWLATELQDMFNGLEQGISNYLYRVQQKLLMGIGWEFDNISMDLISWLKRIYSRMGGNGISKPDPTTDTKGFWDWLAEQFAKFIADLVGKPLDAAEELFDLLKDFFPFSLPWDFYTMMGLLAHDPVTPVFDLPMPVPAVVSSGHTHGIHIDCHAWDDTMFVVRSLEFLFFAYKIFNMVPKWFNFIKVAEE